MTRTAFVTGVTGQDGKCNALMLQQPAAEDCVIAMGRQFSIRQFVERAVRELGWQPRITFERHAYQPIARYA